MMLMKKFFTGRTRRQKAPHDFHKDSAAILTDEHDIDKWVEHVRPLIATKAKQQTPSAAFLQQALFQRVASVSGAVQAESQQKSYSLRALEQPAHAMIDRNQFAHFISFLGMPEFSSRQMDALYESYHKNSIAPPSQQLPPSLPQAAAPITERPLNTMEFCRQLASIEVPEKQWKVWSEDERAQVSLADLESQGRHNEASQMRQRLAVGLATATDVAKLAAHRHRPRTDVAPAPGYIHHGPAAADKDFKVDQAVAEVGFKLEQVINTRTDMMREIAAENRSVVQNERDARLAAMSAAEAASERVRMRPEWMPPQRDWGADIPVESLSQPPSNGAKETSAPAPSAPLETTASTSMTQRDKLNELVSQVQRLPPASLQDAQQSVAAVRRLATSLGFTFTHEQTQKIVDRVQTTRKQRHDKRTEFYQKQLAEEASKPQVPGGMVTLPLPPPPPMPSDEGFTVAELIENLLPECFDPTRFEPRDKPPQREPTMRELKAIGPLKQARFDAGRVDTIDSFGRRHKGRRLGTGGDVIAAARNELSAFVRAVTTNDGTLPPRQEVVRLFDRGDFQPARGRAHTIDCDAFGRMVDDLGMNLTKEEKSQLFHSYGPQSDGKLRAEAFLVGLTGNKDATPFTETDPNPEPVRFPKQPRQYGPARLPVAADEPVVDSASTDDVLRHIKERIEFKNPLPGRAKADFVREFGFTDNARTGIIGEAALRKALWRGGFGLPEAHIQHLLKALPPAGRDSQGVAQYDYRQLWDRLNAVPEAKVRRPRSPQPPPPSGERLMGAYDSLVPPPQKTLEELIAGHTHASQLFTTAPQPPATHGRKTQTFRRTTRPDLALAARIVADRVQAATGLVGAATLGAELSGTVAEMPSADSTLQQSFVPQPPMSARSHDELVPRKPRAATFMPRYGETGALTARETMRAVTPKAPSPAPTPTPVSQPMSNVSVRFAEPIVSAPTTPRAPAVKPQAPQSPQNGSSNVSSIRSRRIVAPLDMSKVVAATNSMNNITPAAPQPAAATPQPIVPRAPLSARGAPPPPAPTASARRSVTPQPQPSKHFIPMPPPSSARRSTPAHAVLPSPREAPNGSSSWRGPVVATVHLKAESLGAKTGGGPL